MVGLLIWGTTAYAQEKQPETVLLDFEAFELNEFDKTTHAAVVTFVEDVPQNGGKLAAKTVVEQDVDAKQYFGTGFHLPISDLSQTGEVRFWIKADFESEFHLQLHSRNGASVFPFSNFGSKNKWLQIAAPLESFGLPSWTKTEADLQRVTYLQVTAFGSGPYDGKTLLVDQFAMGPTKVAADFERISLTKIGDRHWLVGSDGQPFFAHGITHASNRMVKFDLGEFSTACRKVGFNAYGYGCPDPLRQDMPYLESWNHLVPISMYRNGDKTHQYVDIFDPEEQTRIEKGVKASCRRSKNNPNCIGYCWTDLATWPLENTTGKSWVDFIRALPDGTPGQQAYQQFLKTWEGAEGKERDQAFLRLIAREYFRVIGEANRKYDPEHLIFGDRLSFYTFDQEVLEEMVPWIDAIAFQPNFWGPFPKKEFDQMYESTGKPILICDFAIRFGDGEKKIDSWKMSDDSFAAAEAYTDYLRAAMDSNYVLGVFWCNPVDTPKGFNKPGVKQGFFADGLSERPGLHEAVSALNAYRKEITPKLDEDREK